MPNRPSIIGQVFGRLTVVSKIGMKGTRQLWLCKCTCGNEHTATTGDLRYGSVQSCGCFLKGYTAANFKHGHSERHKSSATYNSWRGMIERCTNPKQPHYRHYGGRGIKLCPQWATFENFLADMGERPEGKTLDRIDVNGNYEPSNCRWATTTEQALNTRRRKARELAE